MIVAQMKVFYTVLLIILGAVAYPLYAQRGDNPDGEILYIDIHATGDSKTEAVSTAIIENTASELEKHKVQIRQAQSDYVIHTRLWESREGIIYFDIQSNISPTSEISPLLDELYPVLSRIKILKSSFDTSIATASDLMTAMSLYTLGLCETAAPYFEAVILYLESLGQPREIVDTIRSIRFYQGNCAILENNIEQAIVYLEAGLYYENDKILLGSSTIHLAWAYLQVNREKDALELMNRLVMYSKAIWSGGAPYFGQALEARAQIYGLLSQYTVAITDLNIAMGLSGGLPDLYFLRGQMYLAQYEWDKALEDFNSAIELTPYYADAYYQRGLLYASILQTGIETRGDALADFEYYLELDPLGQYAEAAAHYAESIRAELEALEEPAP